jgi:hypothetical protein
MLLVIDNIIGIFCSKEFYKQPSGYGIVSICFSGCKKDNNSNFEDNPSSFQGDGYVYADGDPAVVAGGIGWYLPNPGSVHGMLYR